MFPFTAHISFSAQNQLLSSSDFTFFNIDSDRLKTTTVDAMVEIIVFIAPTEKNNLVPTDI